MNFPKEYVAVGDVVELTVRRQCKNKDQKRTMSTNSKSVQKTERKRSDNGKTGRENWRDILGQQNVASIKEAQSHKNKDKLPKRNVNKDQQKNVSIIQFAYKSTYAYII